MNIMDLGDGIRLQDFPQKENCSNWGWMKLLMNWRAWGSWPHDSKRIEDRTGKGDILK